MLDETFAESLAHKPVPVAAALWAALTRSPASGHKIIGRRLRPFTFWAAANLDFIKSPFAGHPLKVGTISFPDIYLSTEACRLPYPKTLNISRLDFEYRAWFYGRKFARDLKYRFAQTRAFTSYIKDYGACGPEYVIGDGQPVKLPWYLYHVAMLVKHAGFTQSQAWETPISFGQWWVTAMLTAAGNNIDLVTPEDREQLSGMGEPANGRKGEVSHSPTRPFPDSF